MQDSATSSGDGMFAFAARVIFRSIDGSVCRAQVRGTDDTGEAGRV